jgi:hypothetical protein
MILPDKINDQFFDLKGLEAYSALKVPTLRDHIRAGDLPCFKVKGKILIRRSEFDAWIEGYRLNKKQNLNNLVDDVLKDLKR